MPEWRTEKQIEADQRLHAAIADMLAAYSDDPERHVKFMLTEYIVISARVGIEDDVVGRTQYDYALANGSIPWHNMMGLMDWARQTMESQMADSNEDGGD